MSNTQLLPSELTSRLSAAQITLGYQDKIISTNLSVDIPDGLFTVILGPNGCGKSTLLRGLSKLLLPKAGDIQLDGRNLKDFSSKSLAKIIGLLPQSSLAPDDITVHDLITRGRFPHQSFLRRWTKDDEQAVNQAINATQLAPLLNQKVSSLSGGQRQRVWIAMVLAQQTPYLLLDEPTTYLDIAHQIELLDLFKRLNTQSGHTIVAVLHDLNHACRYADNLIVMKEGAIIAEGAPINIMTESLVEQVYGIKNLIIEDPVTGTPLVLPK